MKEVMLLHAQTMGRGSDELGKKLMGVFLKKLWSNPDKPEAIIFYNESVRLLTIQGGCVEALHGLSESGVDLVACGTCINHFELADDIQVGRVSGMEEIVSLIQRAEKVVTI